MIAILKQSKSLIAPGLQGFKIFDYKDSKWVLCSVENYQSPKVVCQPCEIFLFDFYGSPHIICFYTSMHPSAHVKMMMMHPISQNYLQRQHFAQKTSAADLVN